tara:strand:+ start:566 stop:679 length:114 start_codon:yes stop_codon:yes gene_type:complete
MGSLDVINAQTVKKEILVGQIAQTHAEIVEHIVPLPA